MTQQGKQMRVGACTGFAYHSVKLALLAVFLSGKAFSSFEVLPCPQSDLF
jgi:hypothetical protein